MSPFFRYREVDSARRPDGRLEIAVQGVISFNRRDYPFLVALCERLAQRAPREEFVFNILGDVRLRDGPRLVRMVQERGLADRFRFHPGLSDRQFFDELSGADFIMPLLNAQRDSYAGAAKVTAAYGHSGAYGIPMILHRDTAELWDITDEACLRFDRRADLVDRLAGGVSDRAAMAVRYREVIAQKVEQNKAFLQMLAREHPTLHRGHRG